MVQIEFMARTLQVFGIWDEKRGLNCNFTKIKEIIIEKSFFRKEGCMQLF